MVACRALHELRHLPVAPRLADPRRRAEHPRARRISRLTAAKTIISCLRPDLHACHPCGAQRSRRIRPENSWGHTRISAHQHSCHPDRSEAKWRDLRLHFHGLGWNPLHARLRLPFGSSRHFSKRNFCIDGNKEEMRTGHGSELVARLRFRVPVWTSFSGLKIDQGYWAFMRLPVNVIDVLVSTQLSPFGSQT